MKKLVLSTALLLTAGFTFAQEDAVKQAKRLMNSGDLSQAETLIEGAVTNAETKGHGHRGAERGTAQRDDRHQERRDGLCPLQEGRGPHLAPQPEGRHGGGQDPLDVIPHQISQTLPA